MFGSCKVKQFYIESISVTAGCLFLGLQRVPGTWSLVSPWENEEDIRERPQHGSRAKVHFKVIQTKSNKMESKFDFMKSTQSLRFVFMSLFWPVLLCNFFCNLLTIIRLRLIILNYTNYSKKCKSRWLCLVTIHVFDTLNNVKKWTQQY